MGSRPRRMVLSSVVVLLLIIGGRWIVIQPSTAALMAGWWEGLPIACFRGMPLVQIHFGPDQQYIQHAQDVRCRGSYTLTRNGLASILTIQDDDQTTRYTVTLFANTLTLTTETGEIWRYTRRAGPPCEAMCDP